MSLSAMIDISLQLGFVLTLAEYLAEYLAKKSLNALVMVASLMKVG